jgi:hypothetical protein
MNDIEETKPQDNTQSNLLLEVTPPCKVKIFIGDDGYEGLGFNAPAMFANSIGDILAERSGTYGLVWHMEGCNAVVSLRSKGDFDVERLAAVYNGKGNKNAAEFSVFGHEMISQIWDW